MATIRNMAQPLRRGLAALALLAMLGGAVPTGAALAAGPREGFADLAEKLLPGVVNISTTQTIKQDRAKRGGDLPQLPPGSPLEELFKEFLDRQRGGNDQRPDQPPRRATSLGSGFIIDPAGYVVTNNHVIADADEISVTLHDDTTLKATLVGRDTKMDLALLKVESKKPLPAVAFGDSDKTRVGDWVLAIGNPFGLGGTVTAGILSARARDIGGPYDDFFQTDASINRGNSGGPLFNSNGDVIGINTAIYSPSGGSVGIGFAIPANLAKPVIDQLRQFGKTRRGWIGVKIQSVTDEVADSLGLDKARGALVASTADSGPAAKAKIQPGDVILRFDGRDVGEMRRLPRIVAETGVDRSVDVTVWRQRKEVTLKIQVGEQPDTDQQAAAVTPPPDTSKAPATGAALGLKLSAITPALRERFGLADEARGVVVTDVADNSAAAESGVRVGDLIVEIGQEEVKAPGDVASKVTQAKDAKRKSVLLLLDQKGDMRFVTVRIDRS